MTFNAMATFFENEASNVSRLSLLHTDRLAQRLPAPTAATTHAACYPVRLEVRACLRLLSQQPNIGPRSGAGRHILEVLESKINNTNSSQLQPPVRYSVWEQPSSLQMTHVLLSNSLSAPFYIPPTTCQTPDAGGMVLCGSMTVVRSK